MNSVCSGTAGRFALDVTGPQIGFSDEAVANMRGPTL